MRPFPELLRKLAEPVNRLYQGWFSKAEIESGRYDQRRILDYGREQWQNDEQQIKRARGTLPLQLAVFLAQREEETAD